MEHTKANGARFWQRPTHQMASVEVNKASLGGLLAPLLSYKFLLPMPQLRAGFAYAGSRLRLRRFVRDLLQGHRPLKIGALGGSVTWGQGASNRTHTGWLALVAHWLAGSFPLVNITARNGAVPATPASYMVMCLEHYVDPDVDLVFLEYVLDNGMQDDVFNNEIVAVMERLIRKLLDLPGHPAVVLMQVLPPGMATRGYLGAVGFQHTLEDLEGSLAQYYDVQYLSLRTAVYHLAALESEGFRRDQLFVDQYPSDAGHRIMADLVAYMIQDTALDLVMDPFSTDEISALQKRLPDPMYDGNIAPNRTLCLIGQLLVQAVASANGFDYVNEGSAIRPKWGYVALTPGARLVLRFDTRRHLPGANPDELVGLYLQYLKSYEHMGIASIRCTSGCNCKDAEVDAHIPEHGSGTYQMRLMVSQSEACELTTTVSERTSSGQHKFKVSGVVISETQSSANMLDGTADPQGRLVLHDSEEDKDVRMRRRRRR
ncbi:hypothetical protein PLESTF_000116500 [Pleodorina starrii]|nr:hypothetical protein PLESTF_000116500 [Pleodorina starrii]